jgi:hypothetical protein
LLGRPCVAWNVSAAILGIPQDQRRKKLPGRCAWFSSRR